MLISIKRSIASCLAAATFAVVCFPTAAAAEDLWYPYSSKLGADGYDVVAYFTEDSAVKGSKKHAADHGGVKWLFSSKENRDAFKADPAQYVPQYGGYCAYAMGRGYQAFGDPEVWAVHEDRLFFNYNRPTQITWTVNKQEYIVSADQNWPKVVAAAAGQ